MLNILTAQDKVINSVIKLELQRCRAEIGDVTTCLKLPTLFEATKQMCLLHDIRYLLLIPKSMGPYLPCVEWHMIT
jgi:hypothetical protein